MLRGAIVAESLRLGAVVDGVPLVVRKLERVDAGVEGQLPHWTLSWFEAHEADADRLAAALAEALEANGGWYADFHSDVEVTVVFAGHVFYESRLEAPRVAAATDKKYDEPRNLAPLRPDGPVLMVHGAVDLAEAEPPT